ncbi:MAG: hypothetical protein WCQ95_13575 [Bacteroidota bacterium]
MNAFFWFLFIVFISWLVFLYIIPFVGRIYFRRLAKRFQNQSEKNARSDRPEGSVHVDYVPDDQKKSSAPGDYVDFEEINENKK